MVFEDDVVTEDAAIFGGVLLDDREVGNNDNDAAQAVSAGVGEGKGHRCEGLAAAGGDGEGEKASGERGAFEGGVEDAVTKSGQRAAWVFGVGGFIGAFGVDCGEQGVGIERRIGRWRGGPMGGVEAVSVNDARENQAGVELG